MVSNRVFPLSQKVSGTSLPISNCQNSFSTFEHLKLFTIYAIIGIGAALAAVVIVLIVRTRGNKP